MIEIKNSALEELRTQFSGEVYTDLSTRLQYATDASAYREVPALVTRPKNAGDIRKLILFASKHNLPIIPRAAGTSLAGQVVGHGIIADISRHMNQVLEINKDEYWVRVEPGVVLEELNMALNDDGLFFGPETSTANRCLLGGMVGNNACGAHSLIYGSTRDHLLAVNAILSDGSHVEFKPLKRKGFEEKCQLQTLEGEIYRNIRDILSDDNNRESIRASFPDPVIKRRNHGYAIDLLLDTSPFSNNDKEFNFCKIIAGSEGTLAFITEIKLNLVPLPPAEKALFCMHCNSLEEAFEANLIALKYKPGAVELMDSKVLKLTKGNLTQQKNRFFIKGDPAAILIIEFARNSKEEIEQIALALEKDMRQSGYGYHFPLVFDEDIQKVWNLRKAGLGVLSNMPGDAKPVALIEDTAVKPEDLPAYMNDFSSLLERHQLECVYHAHIGSGELHLRPVLNLKNPGDVLLFKTIAIEMADLVKKYRGSLSGEHGDGRLRGALIPLMIGDDNYAHLRAIKRCWDPKNIFNPGKIIDTEEITEKLRYVPGQETKELNTYFDFSADKGIMRAAEKCNGSGDCRKSHLIGGTMCPSFMATRDENKSTRARANILREFLTRSQKENPFDQEEIYHVMDLCLSCKACKSECPSNVDITKYKAEFLQHYYDARGISLRTRLIANIGQINRIGALFPAFFNLIVKNPLLSGILKRSLGFAPRRSIPLLYKTSLRTWVNRNNHSSIPYRARVFLFADEFTNYNDAGIGIKCVKLLRQLGYEVLVPKHHFSGRTYLSKGLVKKAARLANKNVSLLSDLISQETPLIGIEPSGILSFRDEYPELADKALVDKAVTLSKHCYTIDEFLANEFKRGKIQSSSFHEAEKKIKLHGHCYQKALSSVQPTMQMLTIPANYEVEEIKSGCCGMAGAFGYEKEHYELSMQVGELVLFPDIRKEDEKTIIAAPGTSCRHQIKDGTGRRALHPVEILYDALK